MADQPKQAAPPIRVALFVDEDGLRRFGRVLRYLSVGLVDEGVHLRVLSPDPRVSNLSFGPIQSVVYENPHWPMTGIRRRRLIDALSVQQPRLIHALSAGTYRTAMALADGFDAELIFVVSSMADCALLERIALDRAACFIPTSGPLAEVLEQELHIPASKIELIRPGVLAASKNTSFVRADRLVTMLCTTPLERGRGLERLVEALAILRRRDIRLLTFMLGQGPLEHLLRKMAGERGLSADITFANPLGDRQPAVESTDIFVFPAEETAFHVDGLLAMAAGSVVITFANPACDQYIPGETAIVCTELEAEAIAEAIAQPLTDLDFARRLASAGLEYVRKNHSISAMASRTAAVYRRLDLARRTIPMRSSE